MASQTPEFADPELRALLDEGIDIDRLGFGVIVMDRTGVVQAYNRAESELSGLEPDRAIGRNFFQEVGPCTNNFLVAQRFVDADDLDDTIDYVFTFRMAPTPVRLRLMAPPDSDHWYLAVQRR